MYLSNISKVFTINNMKNWIRSCNFFPIDTNDILDIHKYLMKRTWYKTLLGLIKEISIGLLTGLVDY